MSEHFNEDGKFQSDKYPTCPAGKVPLSTKDPMAQDLLWAYAQRRRAVDASFADDLETCLRADGYCPALPTPTRIVRLDTIYQFVSTGNDNGITTADIRMCQEYLHSKGVPPGDDGTYVFVMFGSKAKRKAYEEALRARGEALPKGMVLTP